MFIVFYTEMKQDLSIISEYSYNQQYSASSAGFTFITFICQNFILNFSLWCYYCSSMVDWSTVSDLIIANQSKRSLAVQICPILAERAKQDPTHLKH